MGTRRLRIAVGAVGLSFLLAVVLGVTGVLVPRASRTAFGATTTISIISGGVSVRHAGSADFVTVQDGDILVAGDTVRTAADARAVLTYFEGSTVEIEPSSELVINAANGNPDGSTVIQMTQNAGRTWHVVTHLVTGNSKYDVSTPTSTASVRGTAFTVDVSFENGTPVATVTTTEGRVGHSATDPTTGRTVEVPVAAGFTQTTKQGEKPPDPKPAPPPQRKVTVTVGASDNSLVVDPFGRANGLKNGRLVLQTPGAQLSIVNGKLVITLPNVPDGKFATHVDKRDDDKDVDVETTVEVEGKGAVTTHDTVKPKDGKGSTGVELGAGQNNAPSFRPLWQGEKDSLPTGKVSEPPTQEGDAGSSGASGPGGPGGPGGGQGGGQGPGGGAPETKRPEPGQGQSNQPSAKPTDKGGGQGASGPGSSFVPQISIGPLPGGGGGGTPGGGGGGGGGQGGSGPQGGGKTEPPAPKKP